MIIIVDFVEELREQLEKSQEDIEEIKEMIKLILEIVKEEHLSSQIERNIKQQRIMAGLPPETYGIR